MKEAAREKEGQSICVGWRGKRGKRETKKWMKVCEREREKEWQSEREQRTQLGGRKREIARERESTGGRERGPLVDWDTYKGTKLR